MKSIFSRFKYKIAFKESPPPYSVNDSTAADRERHASAEINAPVCEVLDLLADCKIADDGPDTEYEEIRDMGLWQSTPHRHKSKISLTWVLKDNLENTKLPMKKIDTEDLLKSKLSEERNRERFNESERHRKCKSSARGRVVGRNEYYHNLRFRSACEEFARQDSCSDDTSVVEEYARRRHRHRHRRKKKPQHSKFGYDIRDLDSFLSEATLDHPGNIPVVIAYPTTLHQTHKDCERELTLPLGTVVNAVFKSQQWVYAQTPHGDEGYVLYAACLPLGILPSRSSPQKKTPCWESSTDIYPRPCGNLTDTEKEQLRGRTRSECRYPRAKRKQNACAERDFDSLYLKTKSASNILVNREREVRRQTLLVVNSDFKGARLERTLSVNKGDVVVLVPGGCEADVEADWFFVRKKDGREGFIPAVIAGHGYI